MDIWGKFGNFERIWKFGKKIGNLKKIGQFGKKSKSRKKIENLENIC